ncbi:acyltransferase family protein [Chryseobacterium sp. 5_R23647]|uniref:acyltransferase family protein n=1 Tax=Chryseobacterium sp. 5_R23647 TaxID=2258964 RepID=UPI000E24DBC3|nr:acyltransferase [Chryseobacterium sp. 5_R23647]REC40323.1 acyltransferase [Chryseobacterium sp. 5_R23647]
MGILRFLLAISVVIAHSTSIFGFELVGGQIAVQAFFIISGFYMTLILNEKYIGANHSYRLFISNRALRLYPIYWVVLLLTILYSGYLFISSNGLKSGSFNPYISHFKDLNIGSLLFLTFTNIFLFFQDIVMFLGLDLQNGNLFFTQNFRNTKPMLFEFLFIPQAWTIGVELLFYVIAPFLVRRKIYVIFSLIFCSILLRCFLYYGLDLKFDPWTARFFPTELVFFLLGTLAYHVYKKYEKYNFKKRHLNLIWSSIVLLTVAYGFIEIQFKELIYLIYFFACLPFIFILTKNIRKMLI